MWKKVWIEQPPREGEPTFQVCCFDPARRSRRVERSFKDKRLAEEFRAKLELHLNGQGSPPELEGEKRQREQAGDTPKAMAASTKRPLTETMDRWIRETSGSQKTRYTYRSKARVFEQSIPVRFVEDLTETHVRDFVLAQKEAGKSHAACRPLLSFQRRSRSRAHSARSPRRGRRTQPGRSGQSVLFRTRHIPLHRAPAPRDWRRTGGTLRCARCEMARRCLSER